MSDDYSKLVADVERALGARPEPDQPARGPSRGDRAPRRRPAAVTATAVVAGALDALIVFGLFSVVPFLGGTSGAAGAFLGTFVAVLLLRRR